FNQDVGLVEGDRDPLTGKFILYAGTPMEHVATRRELEARNIFIPRQHISHNRIISDNAITINRGRLKINLAFQENRREEYGDPMEPREVELGLDLTTFTYNLQWQLPQSRDWHVTIGASGMLQSNRNKAEEVIIPEYRMRDVGAFVFGQRFLERTTISGGLRIDHRSLSADELTEDGEMRFIAFDKNFTNIAGSAGLSFEANDHLTLKLNLARGFRAPNMAELGSNGAHEGTDRYEYGMQGLKSENSLQLDGGIDLDQEHVSMSLSAFYNRLGDFIYYRRLSSAGGGDSVVNVDGEELMAYRFDQQDASLAGFEVEIDFHPHPLDWLHFENSLSFVQGRFDESIMGTRNI